ncbi:delta-type opioid receptor-like [Branchiostoma floridae]|uniref:Delta-type opioid receptor-like n=1 Tax=Branchiostoma floridae TaxID=7739 RepID=A0A9J7KAB6_BRAFL|nr:delta-type opioid receptor-like [Branchiostoma floridae]
MSSFPGSIFPPEKDPSVAISPPFPVTTSLEKTVWFPTVHLILAAVGSFANALVIYIIAKKPKMRTYPNIFVLNLAVADFVFCTVATPLTWVVILLELFGGWLQHVTFVSYDMCSFVSVLCLTTLSIERYQAISDPIGHMDRSSRKRAWVINTCLWVLALVLSILGYIFIFLPATSRDMQSQDLISKDLATTLFSFLLSFVIPLVIIVIFYVLLFKTLRQNRGLPVGSRSDIKSRNRVTRMVTAVVVAFVVSWLPGHIINLVYVSNAMMDNKALSYATWACFMLQIVNSVSNPFLYALLGERFGFYIRGIMCGKGVCKQGDSDGRKQQRKKQDNGQTTNRETASTNL